ncbi:MAG TPA: hypothetical protein VGQ83_30505 [Polyangia bacterium]|jgi:hypothetical protein
MRSMVALLMLLWSGGATAGECDDRVKELKSWMAPAAERVGRGAFASLPGLAARLAPAPLRPTTVPRHPAATIEVRAEGYAVDDKPVADAGALKAALARHPNIVFAKGNPNAAARGLLVAVHADAAASRVKPALAAAGAIGEKRVWLLFVPAQAALTPPPVSPVTKELESAGPDVNRIVQVVRTTFEPCPSLIDTMRRASGMFTLNRLPLMLQELPAGLARCRCATPPAAVASILWVLALRDLVTAVELPLEQAAALPWPADVPWRRLAPKVLAAVGRQK